MHGATKRQYGLTLTEAMTTLAMLAILTGIALPGTQTLLKASRIRTTVSELGSDFALARISAISANAPVVVCPSDGKHCVGDNQWARGWIVFRDTDRNHQPDSANDIVLVRQTRNGHLRIVTNAGRPHLRYLPNGMSQGSNLTLSICDGVRLAAQIVVNNTGRIRTRRPQDTTPCPG
ncbi:pilus assembly protein [Lysobacter pythonis]|uniref:Type II secretion system protein H n=1 Tax=Solilutibacter pythonis TaxID=2483112 RepID=A0A3M2I8F2_9GAMM|nr:Tfp pilus assembly protein FimT/FimU [Lysobacter pythonis]RMH94574.1 pilus assembly protein [Lysobacter pythonis]